MVGLKRKRTAVLVVHGIGSQRAQSTVRGVVDAVWFDRGNPTSGSGNKKVWTHPEQSGIDLDLSVMTTSGIPGAADNRSADFHEFYWAHLMSETKAIAVLLWLYELARKGPHFKPGMNGLWWGVAWFLCLLNLSLALLAIQAVTLFIGLDESLHKLVVTPYLMASLASAAVLFAIHYYGVSNRLPNGNYYLLAICLIPAAGFLIVAGIVTAAFAEPFRPLAVAKWVTDALLPTAVAALATFLLMGRWGWQAFKLPYAFSFVFVALYLLLVWLFREPIHGLSGIHWPWSIGSQSSAIAAFLIVGIYLAANAAFLQPYLGDAARYFRNSPANVAVRREIRKQAVDTLERLHLCGEYDRVVIVAHSLGSIIAYDMLRAYYSRINQGLPDPKRLGPDFDLVDGGLLPKAEARAKARAIVGLIAAETENARQRIAEGKPEPGDSNSMAWLVTDFITLGSPLTHARYLICDGKDESDLRQDFERRTRERELPTCPPRKLNGDNHLTFIDPNDSRRRFHHGGQFALTRWTNLYFPLDRLLWGDAIGGPVAELFGDPGTNGVGATQHVADVPVCIDREHSKTFFSHTLYWETATKEGYAAPHVEALKQAIDLEDLGTANAM